MKRLRSAGIGLLLVFILMIAWRFVHAQEMSGESSAFPVTDTNVDWNSLSDFEVTLKAIESMPTVSAAQFEAMGLQGTFYSAQHVNDWPPLPADVLQLPLWLVESNLFLIDDVNFDYAAYAAARSTQTGTMQTLDDSGPPAPGDTNSWSTNSGPGPLIGGGIVIDTNGFWLEITGVSNGWAYLVLHGTTNDVQYEILSQASLSDTNWDSEGLILGSDETNWTATAVATADRANGFFWARSWEDSTGTGIPDWWWLKYFGTTAGADAYADPDGDGWNNLQEFQNGTEPKTFNTPGAPPGLRVGWDSVSGEVNVSWQASPGTVTGYTVEKFDYAGWTTSEFEVSSGTSFSDYVPNVPSYPEILGPTRYTYYRVQAHYGTSGDSTWSEPELVEPNYDDPSYATAVLPINLISDSEGSAYLLAASLPAGTVALRLARMDNFAETYYGDFSFDTNWDIPVSALTGGAYQLPADMVSSPFDGYGEAYYFWWVQAVLTNNGLTAATFVAGGYSGNQSQPGPAVPPRVDGRVQLKQNLDFLLRAATVDTPFQFAEVGTNASYSTFSGASNYACASFYTHSSSYNDPSYSFDAFQPFKDNHRYRNFVFSQADLDTNGLLTTGVSGYYNNFYGGLVLEDPAEYQFQGATNALLDTGQTEWLCSYALESPYDELYKIGVAYNDGSSPYFQMADEARNLYGLRFLSAEAVHVTGSTVTPLILSASGTLDASSPGYYLFYQETAPPQYQTVGYEFWQPGMDYLPGMTGFLPTNPNRPLFASVGTPTRFAGYAKLAVTNGYAGVYGYLGQYFERAYAVDGNGSLTTNKAGLLSAYGDFLPTEPGPAALVTMPDIDTGERGTGVVNAVKLQLDVNHDGVMDLSYTGPDNTAPNQPFVFWANNDYDAPGSGSTPDHDVNNWGQPNMVDYNRGAIGCQRNLEDFARLWVCGLPKLPSTSGYTITLGMTATSGNPAINLYAQYDTNGSAAYLTDTNAAAQQFAQYLLNGQVIFDFSKKLSTISPSQTYTLPVFSDGTPEYTHFLFEGAGIGLCQLTLTISQTTAQGSNVIAQTSTWIDLHDVKDFFEHPRASDVSLNDPPTTNTGAYTIDSYQTVNDGSEDNQIIVFVHGINNSPWDYENTSETMFKRLYWQGYHGRFAAFRWPSPTWATFLPTSQDQISKLNFNKGEYIAWQSATALKNYIADLRSRFPGYTINLMTHSLGGIVGNEAIQLGAQVDNYAMCQAAVAAEAFDGSNTNLIYDYLASGAGGTPDANALGGYNDCFRDSTRRINFYNDDDWAVYQGPVSILGVNVTLHIWEGNQLSFRPDSFTYPGGFSYRYSFDGANCFYRDYDGEGNLLTSRTLTQDFEKKSYVARSRTKGVGAAGLAHDPFALTGGSVTANVSLQNASIGFVGGTAFGNTRPEHSGEFTKNIQNAVPFYQQLLQTGFQITPNP